MASDPQHQAHAPIESILSINELGYYMPENIISTRELQTEIKHMPRVAEFDIEQSTGIVERRIAGDDLSIIDMIESASRDAIMKFEARNGFDHREIDTIIFGGISREHLEPAAASLLQKRLGIPRGISFDITNACLGFLDALMIVDSMIKSGVVKKALIVCAEKPSIIMKLTIEAMKKGTHGEECRAIVTVGDGAVAGIMTGRGALSRLNVIAYSRVTMSDFAEYSFLPDRYSPMVTNSRGIVKESIENCPGLITDMMNATGWKARDLAALVIHQINIPVVHAIADAVGVPREKCPITCDRFGNMASVSAPFTLISALNERDFKKGDKIIVCGIGAGMSFMVLAIEVN